jgi:hypothetical protein
VGSMNSLTRNLLAAGISELPHLEGGARKHRQRHTKKNRRTKK